MVLVKTTALSANLDSLELFVKLHLKKDGG